MRTDQEAISELVFSMVVVQDTLVQVIKDIEKIEQDILKLKQVSPC